MNLNFMNKLLVTENEMIIITSPRNIPNLVNLSEYYLYKIELQVFEINMK